MKYKHNLVWVVVFAVIVLMFLRLPPMVAQQDTVLNTYRALVEVDALARQRYIEPIKENRFVDGAIRGMMLELDPYSGYIAPGELPGFDRASQGDYIGVGIELGIHNGQPTVIAPIAGGSAARAGILAGDTIVAINGEETEELSVFELDERFRGKPGSSLQVTVRHLGVREPVTVTLTRSQVSFHTVRGFRRLADRRWDYLIDPAGRIGYIRVSSFHKKTMPAFDQALKELRNAGMKGLILDLRFNPGGLMEQAVEMVDRFVAEGIILSTVSRTHAVRKYLAHSDRPAGSVPVAVLINGGSASAAEIVAGSLQDHHRAVIVGTRSFGKGSVQGLFYLKSIPAAVKLTQAYYRLPGGRMIHRTPKNQKTDSWGVFPDVEVTLSADEVEAMQRSRKRLDFTPSVSDTVTPPPQQGGKPLSSPSPSLELIRDRQLQAALARLRK